MFLRSIAILKSLKHRIFPFFSLSIFLKMGKKNMGKKDHVGYFNLNSQKVTGLDSKVLLQGNNNIIEKWRELKGTERNLKEIKGT